MFNHCYEFSKINFTKFKSKMIKSLTSQLIGLVLWLAPTQILTLAHKDNMLEFILKEISMEKNKYEMEH